jgi:hypothetical protein
VVLVEDHHDLGCLEEGDEDIDGLVGEICAFLLVPRISAMLRLEMVPMTSPLFVTMRGSTLSSSIRPRASVMKADFAMDAARAITSLTVFSLILLPHG